MFGHGGMFGPWWSSIWSLGILSKHESQSFAEISSSLLCYDLASYEGILVKGSQSIRQSSLLSLIGQVNQKGNAVWFASWGSIAFGQNSYPDCLAKG